MTKFQKIIGMIILIIVVPFAAWTLRTHLDENIAKAMAIQKELEKEFAKVAVMPGAVQTSYSDNKPTKRENPIVHATYIISNKEQADLHGFYLKEMKKNGWVLAFDLPPSSWGRAGEMRFYKEEYESVIIYGFDSERYSISLITKGD